MEVAAGNFVKDTKKVITCYMLTFLWICSEVFGFAARIFRSLSETYSYFRLDLVSCVLLVVLYGFIFLGGLLGNLAIVAAMVNNKVK